MPPRSGEEMTDSPVPGPVPRRGPGAGATHTPPNRHAPEVTTPALLRLTQRAPNGAGVKDLRAAARSAFGRSLTPTPLFRAPETRRRTAKTKISTRNGL